MKVLKLFILMISLPIYQGFSQELSYHTNFTSNAVHSETPSKKYFVFYANDRPQQILKELNSIEESDFRKHSLGDEIARRMYLLEKTFTYTAETVPGSFTGKRIIHKPVIYFSIFKIEKYFRQKVKNSAIEPEVAVKELSRYIDTAIFLYHENTVDFENALDESGKAEDQMATFQRVKLESY